MGVSSLRGNVLFLAASTALGSTLCAAASADAQFSQGSEPVTLSPVLALGAARTVKSSVDTQTGSNPGTDNQSITQGGQSPSLADGDSSTTTAQYQTWEKESPEDKNTIIVTGTSIRGIGASAGTKPIAITQEDIQRSGYATTSQIMAILPQNFISGYTEHASRTTENNFNFTSSTSPDLRGLGQKATLVLLNGRRLPSVGMDTTSLDISSIPAALIERIEVLPDGASSVYGADAVAGVVNIILKKKYDGAETRARFGHTTEGGLRELNFSQTFGTSWKNGSLFVGYEYFDRTNLFHTDRKYTRSDDLRPFGGTDRTSFFGSPANILNPLTYQIDFAVPELQNRQPLLPSDLLPPDQANLFSIGSGTDLIPEQQRHSIYAHARQEITSELSLLLEGRFGDRDVHSNSGYTVSILPVTSDYPFYIDAYGDGRPLLVAYNFSKELGTVKTLSHVKSYNFTTGLEYNLSQDLQLRAYGTYSKEKTDTRQKNFADIDRVLEAMQFTDPKRTFNIFGNGDDNNPETLAYITAERLFRTAFSIIEFNSLLEGSLFQVPGGDARFALGGSYRKDKAWSDGFQQSISEKRFRRRVVSAFGELYLPLVSEQNRMALVESLTASLSGRLDSYKDRPLLPENQPSSRQTTFNPKVGLSWEIFRGYQLRATYGTSFATPSLDNRIATTTTATFPMDDPRSPTGTSYTMLISGTAPGLKNEKATTWTVGATIAPPQIPSLRFDASFFYIKFKDRIIANTVSTDVLIREDEFAPIITRNPTVDQVRDICAIAEDSPTLDGCLTPELIDVIIDTRTNNHSQSIVRGIDFELGYNFSVGSLGSLNLYANASYLIDHKFRFLSTTPTVSNLNNLGQPVDFRSRLAATWISGPVSFATFLNYTNDYRNRSSEIKPKIGSWTTVDVSLSYNFDESNARLLRGFVLNLSCINLLANDPPFADTFYGYDGANASPLGRFASISITKKW